MRRVLVVTWHDGDDHRHRGAHLACSCGDLDCSRDRIGTIHLGGEDGLLDTMTVLRRIANALGNPEIQREVSRIEMLRSHLEYVPHQLESCVDVHRPHSLQRWAKVIVKTIDLPGDPRTLSDWGRAIGVSVGGLRNWCACAGIKSKQSLMFARLLRAVVRQRQTCASPEELLDIVDRRTVVKVLVAAGGVARRLPLSEDEFLDRQTFVSDRRAIETVRNELESRRAAASTRECMPPQALIGS